MLSLSRMIRIGALTVTTTLSLCAQGPAAFADEPDGPAAYYPAPGSNRVLAAPLETASGLEVIVSDVLIPANANVPPHSHPGEEFVFVIEGAAVHVEDGKQDRVYSAGEAFVIRRGKVHAPRGMDQPARAIVFRVHVAGEPERIPAE